MMTALLAMTAMTLLLTATGKLVKVGQLIQKNDTSPDGCALATWGMWCGLLGIATIIAAVLVNMNAT